MTELILIIKRSVIAKFIKLKVDFLVQHISYETISILYIYVMNKRRKSFTF